MNLTRWDILAKVDDFAVVSERARLSRWKWEMLEAIDGTRDIGAVAAKKLLDPASALSFAEEALEANLVRLVTLTYSEFHGVADAVEAIATPAPEVAPEPEPEPVAALEPAPQPEPEPEPVVLAVAEPEPVVALEPEPVPEPVVVAETQPEPVAAVQAAPPPAAPTSLAERMAALRARALKSIEQKPAPAAYAPVEPPVKIEPVEFSLSSEPKPEPARSADEIEFSV